jgi:DUF971 family protein
MTPTKVKHHKAEGSLELAYASDAGFTLSGEYLRVHSPSAEVRGHGPGQEILQHGKKGVRIASVEPVGNYALLLHFDDGHNTGIYSWGYLRELGDNYEQYWQNYLDKLNQAGQSRDLEVQVVRFVTPPAKP